MSTLCGQVTASATRLWLNMLANRDSAPKSDPTTISAPALRRMRSRQNSVKILPPSQHLHYDIREADEKGSLHLWRTPLAPFPVEHEQAWNSALRRSNSCRKLYEKKKETRNKSRREKYKETVELRAARQAQQAKKVRISAKKRREKAQRLSNAEGHSPDRISAQSTQSTELTSMEKTTAATVLEEFQSFTCRNPRRFLQAVVSDYLETKHRPSLFATVAELQTIVNKLNNSSGPTDDDKARKSLLLVTGWANEIRIEVTRSYDITSKRFCNGKFAFQLAHDSDGLGFTVEE
ncbi:hypothetical protein C8J56DRAFT_1066525 [Mycena floridula]|nr:hypothetical protein C8J56DRAFT_1066525 [Mycena floridula]